MSFRVFIRTMLGKPWSFAVSDRPEKWDREDSWPDAAEFKVSLRHDEDTQRRRAHEYRDYLNAGLGQQPPIGAKT